MPSLQLEKLKNRIYLTNTKNEHYLLAENLDLLWMRDHMIYDLKIKLMKNKIKLSKI
jgi:hypothetical protein